MNELRIAYDPDASVTATVIAVSGGAASSVTLTESPTIDGYYSGDFPAVADGYYDVVYREGGFVVGSLSAYWDGEQLLAQEPTSFDLSAIETQLDAIQAKTNLISNGGSVAVVSPVATSGSVSIVRGDDYLDTDGRALAFAFDDAPVLTGATVVLSARSEFSYKQRLACTGVVTGAASVRFELTKEQTERLIAGSYRMDIQATLANGSVVTLLLGTLTVSDDVTEAA